MNQQLTKEISEVVKYILPEESRDKEIISSYTHSIVQIVEKYLNQSNSEQSGVSGENNQTS